jgi:hypothetical protein
MRVMSKFGFTWIAAAILVSSASAQVTPSGKGFLLRAKYKKGTILKFVVNTAMTVQGMKVKNVLAVKETTLSVSNGVGEIEIVTGKSSLVMGGSKVRQPMAMDGKKGTVKLDALGRNADGTGFTAQTHVALPKGVVKLGDSWKINTTAPFGQGEQKVQVIYKVAGFATVDGIRVLKLSETFSGSGKAEISGNGTLYISTKDCSMVKNSATLRAKIGGMDVPVTTLMTRT